MFYILLFFSILLFLIIYFQKNNIMDNIFNIESNYDDDNIFNIEPNYDDVNFFKLKKDKLLFFDIFARNDELIIISPVYCDLNIDYDDISIIFDNNKLELKHKYHYIKWEPIITRIYDLKKFNLQDKYILNLLVDYKKKRKNFRISYNLIDKQHKIVFSTLFKDDDYLLNTWINYYNNQKIDYFYLYVNKPITEQMKKDYSKFKNCKFIQWDFKYWSSKCFYSKKKISKHHAQMGQIYQFIFKYAKPISEWSGVIDLDEYLYIENKKIIDILDLNLNYISFNNYWSKLENNYIPKYHEKCNLYNSKIYIDENDEKFGKERSKYIIKTNNIGKFGIHTFRKTKKTILPNSKMLHFKNWNRKNRTFISKKCINLKE
jgi:hypothetical protein